MWSVVGGCFDHGTISTYGRRVIVRMPLYGICISLLLNLGHAERGRFQNKPGSHGTWGNVCFIGQRPLLCWGYLKGQAFEAQFQSGSVYLWSRQWRNNRGSDGSGGISLSQEPGKGESSSMGYCFAQEETTARHVLVTLALHRILHLCLLCPSPPPMGSEGTAVWTAAHSSILISCRFVMFFHHTPHSLGPQDNPGRQEGRVWRPPFTDEEIEASLPAAVKNSRWSSDALTWSWWISFRCCDCHCDSGLLLSLFVSVFPKGNSKTSQVVRQL